MDGCTGLVFNNQERIVVNLCPNVDILPLASDIDADYLKIRILPGKKSNEALSYTMQLRVCLGVLGGRPAYQPGEHGVLR